MKWIKPLGNMILPTLVFYAVYRAAGILPAVMIALLYSISSAIYSKIKNHAIKNSQIIGVLGLVSSAVAVIFTGEEKLYYIPSIFGNLLFLIFIVVLSIQKKSVLHFLAKDFEITSLHLIPEERMLRINAVWGIYFAIKIISKFVGILYLDFQKLYWLSFLLGDPMTILVIILSVLLIRAHFFHLSQDAKLPDSRPKETPPHDTEVPK